MDRAKKAQEVEMLQKRFDENDMVIITHYSGLTVKQMTQLRSNLRAEGAEFKVAKNTLARRAMEGTRFAPLADQMKGPTGIAMSKDPMAAARIAYAFAKDNDKLIILGGVVGDEVLSVEKIKYLATLPSMDQLRGKLVGLLQAPGAQLARLANAYATKDQEA